MAAVAFPASLCTATGYVCDICCAVSTWITCFLCLAVRHSEQQSGETDSAAFLRGYGSSLHPTAAWIPLKILFSDEQEVNIFSRSFNRTEAD